MVFTVYIKRIYRKKIQKDIRTSGNGERGENY